MTGKRRPKKPVKPPTFTELKKLSKESVELIPDDSVKSTLCTVCTHKKVLQINDDLRSMFHDGSTLAEIARRYKLSYDSLYRHAYNHIKLEVPKKLFPTSICKQTMASPPNAADLVYALRKACTPERLERLMEVALEQAIRKPDPWNIQSVTSLMKLTLPSMKAVEISHNASKDESAKILKAIEKITGKNPELVAKIIQELEHADGPSDK